MAVRANHVPLAGSARALPLGRRIGVPPPHELIRVTVILPPRDRGLRAHVQGLRAIPVRARRYLTRVQFARRFGARPMDVMRIRRFARNNKLHVVHVHYGRRTLVLGGTVANMSAAFGVELGLYMNQNRIFRAHMGPVHIPKWLRSSVQAVLGLDTRP